MNKTKLWIMLLGLSLLYSLPGVGMLSAQTNNMQVMTYMSGEFAGSEFGESIASLDFNGDGYKDLVVSSGAWNPNLTFADQNRWGKLYFYWGGPGFDNIADFEIPGAFNWQMGPYASIYNAGDMNGDGIEDLIMFQRSATYDNNVALFFGRANPHNSPDIILSYSYADVPEGLLFIPLGDVNGDGRSDVSLTVHYTNGAKIVYIWDDYTTQPIPLIITLNGHRLTRLSGIGDVNNDGFDDTLLHIPNNPTGETNNRLVLYYGSPTFPVTDSLVICEDSNSIIKSKACPLGDVNGDGYDDFTAGSLIYDYSQHLWLGSDSLSAAWSLDLSAYDPPPPSYISERGTGYPMVHGDLNGDGYQDVLGFHSEAGYYSGYLYLWMGSPNMNGSLDYVTLGMAGYDCRNYGWSKVTGDFNADGFCDVAVGAPWWGPHNQFSQTGRVYILAGNANLHETTTANDDPLLLPPPQLSIRVFPNPLRREEIVQMEIKTLSAPQGDQAILRIFNSRGQQIYHQEHITLSGKSTNLPLQLQDLANGVYICQLQHGHTVSTTKLTIMKSGEYHEE